MVSLSARATHAGPMTLLMTGALLLCFLGLPRAGSAQAAPTEGEYLYRVTTVRAAPGHFNQLMSALEAGAALQSEAGDEAPFWIRHSQGDHWDFMLIYPMGEFGVYYSPDRLTRRATAWSSEAGRRLSADLERHTSFTEEWYARSAPLPEMRRRFEGMALFHIEMFAGLPGKRGELLEQRRMENRYYQHLDRQLNVLFTREAGANWDAMTIGFYENLQSYAAGGVRYSEAEQDEAARVAGFSGVGDIGPYLRSLLSYHNDTLGVPGG